MSPARLLALLRLVFAAAAAPTCPLNSTLNVDGSCTLEVLVSSEYKYTINGIQSPSLELHRGQIYVFDVQTSSAHGFALGTGQDGPRYDASTGGDGNICNEDGSPVDSDSLLHTGKLVFTPGLDTPSQLWYYCELHTGMGGRVDVLGGVASECPNAAADADDAKRSDLASPSRSPLLIVHGLLMYSAFGLLLPTAAFMAHIGRLVRVRGSALSVHKLLAPAAVLVGCAGVVCAFVGVQSEGSAHMAHSHGVIGSLLILGAVVAQPLAIATGMHAWHRRCSC